MNNKEIYLSHIRDDNVEFKMKQLLDKVDITIRKHIITTSDFMDPYEILTSRSILNRFQDISYVERGGVDQAERKCLTIFPEYVHREDVESPVKALRVEGYIDKLSHKDFLGAILGLGIKREKIGDILFFDDHVVFFVKEEIKDFIILNLEKVGNSKVILKEEDANGLMIPEPEYEELRKFTSSMRVDGYLSALYNISRSDSGDLIKAGLVKVNWEKTLKGDKVLEPGDMVSVRGKGRSLLYKVEGISKKGRYNLLIRKLI